MDKRERVKLIIENWFIEKTNIKPTEEGLNNLVDRITYDKQLSIRVVSIPLYYKQCERGRDEPCGCTTICKFTDGNI